MLTHSHMLTRTHSQFLEAHDVLGWGCVLFDNRMQEDRSNNRRKKVFLLLVSKQKHCVDIMSTQCLWFVDMFLPFIVLSTFFLLCVDIMSTFRTRIGRN